MRLPLLAVLLCAAVGASAYSSYGWYIVLGEGGEIAVSFERGAVNLSDGMNRIGNLSAKEARELAAMLNRAADEVDPPKPSRYASDSAWCLRYPKTYICPQDDHDYFDRLLDEVTGEMRAPGSTESDKRLIKLLEQMIADVETNEKDRLLCSQFITRLRTRIQERASDGIFKGGIYAP